MGEEIKLKRRFGNLSSMRKTFDFQKPPVLVLEKGNPSCNNIFKDSNDGFARACMHMRMIHLPWRINVTIVS